MSELLKAARRLTPRQLLEGKPYRSAYSPERPRPTLQLAGHRERLTESELRDIKVQAAAFCAVVDWELADRATAQS